VVLTGGPAQLLFCRHGSLQGRGCQECGATPAPLMDRSQDLDNTQDKEAVLGRSIDLPPYHLQESLLMAVDANPAFSGSATSHPRTAKNGSLQTGSGEGPEVNITNSPTVVVEED
jgi:hypothetical protein